MRLIGADELKKAFEAWKTMDDYYHDTDCNDIPFSEAFDLIDNAPTVEPEITDDDLQSCMTESYHLGYELAETKFKRPQGEWIITYSEKKKKVNKCGVCGFISIQGKTNYCPNCGAEMQKGDKS